MKPITVILLCGVLALIGVSWACPTRAESLPWTLNETLNHNVVAVAFEEGGMPDVCVGEISPYTVLAIPCHDAIPFPTPDGLR